MSRRHVKDKKTYSVAAKEVAWYSAAAVAGILRRLSWQIGNINRWDPDGRRHPDLIINDAKRVLLREAKLLMALVAKVELEPRYQKADDLPGG